MNDAVNVTLSVLAAGIGCGLLGYAWADVRAARTRDLLVRAIVRQVWATPVPACALLATSRQACKELRGQIATDIATLEGQPRAQIAALAALEPMVEEVSA